MKKRLNAIEQQARQRVEGTPRLKVHEEIILADWPNWDEHMMWVVTAPIEQIVDWAEEIEQVGPGSG